MTTSYQYQAKNEGSYNSLADYAATMSATVTLIPSRQTIVIPESGAIEADEFIDSEGLDFGIFPIEIEDNLDELIESEDVDAATLREVASRLRKELREKESAHSGIIEEITKELDETRKVCDKNAAMWHESMARSCRIREQVQAVSVLLDSIFPRR